MISTIRPDTPAIDWRIVLILGKMRTCQDFGIDWKVLDQGVLLSMIWQYAINEFELLAVWAATKNPIFIERIVNEVIIPLKTELSFSVDGHPGPDQRISHFN